MIVIIAKQPELKHQECFCSSNSHSDTHSSVTDSGHSCAGGDDDDDDNDGGDDGVSGQPTFKNQIIYNHFSVNVDVN